MTMTSDMRLFTPVFADQLVQSNIFSPYLDGHDAVRVISPPTVVRNLVGERTYVTMRVSHMKTNEVGHMTLPASTTVYLKNTKH
jgi:hypothetical protein